MAHLNPIPLAEVKAVEAATVTPTYCSKDCLISVTCSIPPARALAVNGAKTSAACCALRC